MKIRKYNRSNVVKYAKNWANLRNPKYFNYDKLGGDCTNFVSQCIYAGSNIMNYNFSKGWYYINANSKSPSWTGVEFLNNFIITNKTIGPFGRNSDIEEVEIGDIIQLSFDGKKFSHSLVITKILNNKNLDNIFTSSHTDDSLDRMVSSYNFKNIRFIKIDGVHI